MEKEGIVYCKTDKEDRRIKRLYLTEKGRKLKPEMQNIGLKLHELLFLDFDKEEVSTVVEVMRKIALNAGWL
jgi:DNA-binding MarR family transcriptional regulator